MEANERMKDAVSAPSPVTQSGGGSGRLFAMTENMLRVRALTAPARLCALVVAALAFGGCFPRQAGPRLAHFDTLAPAPGERLPSLRVADLAGRELDLADLVGDQPVVLQVGSESCPVFRYRRHGIARLERELRHRVRFLVLYTREAHPVGSASPYAAGEWDLWINRVTGVRLADTTTSEDRRRRAEEVKARLGLVSLVLVDPAGDPGWALLGRAPSAAFVIDTAGRVVARQTWVDPAGLRRVLRELIGPRPPTTPARPAGEAPGSRDRPIPAPSRAWSQSSAAPVRHP